MGKSCCTTDLGLILLVFPFLPASSRLPVGLGLHGECVWGNISREGSSLILELAILFSSGAVQQQGAVGKGI